jgi:hypothetical protein
LEFITIKRVIHVDDFYYVDLHDFEALRSFR